MKRDLIYLTLIAALMAAAQVTAQTAPEAPADTDRAGFRFMLHRFYL